MYIHYPYIYIYIYVYAYIDIHYIYIYVYIERERDVYVLFTRFRGLLGAKDAGPAATGGATRRHLQM